MEKQLKQSRAQEKKARTKSKSPEKNSESSLTKPPSDSSRNKLTAAVEFILETILYPYQREWLLDNSRFKIANKARQIGLSLCVGLEALLDVLRGEPVFFVSRTE